MSYSEIEKTLDKLCFCPTYFITSTMFEKVKNKSPIQLLCGSFGFSKTMSCVLYTLLTRNIIAYRAKYPKLVSTLPLTAQKRYKVIYWTISI